MTTDVALHELLPPSEAARRLLRSTSALSGYERRGDLHSVRVARGLRLFDPREVETLARKLAEAKTR
jgi:hypothetical protein